MYEMGGRKGWQKDRPVEREVTIADLAAEFLARESGSAETGKSVVVVPTPHGSSGDPGECARFEVVERSEKKHTDEGRGGRRDPGVRRPGAGRGQLPARSQIFRAALFSVTWFTLANPYAGRRTDFRDQK